MAIRDALRTGLVALAAVAMAGGLLTGPPAAAAPSGSQFDPALIISDANFFDAASMSQASIQQFLEGQVRTCVGARGERCLKDYRSTTTSKDAAGTNNCGPYAAGTDELASEIIYKVAQACNISPKVLLVTLQKEQGLVTATSPSSTQYRIAMGYGCPDTAPCDTQFYGFGNQVYRAARQFRQYAINPNSWRYRIGPVFVQYHPNAACNGTTVNIRNQATANLYNYTPYQPNGASLANLYGSGDGCSSYGNRNFWRTYFDWFGDPTTGRDTFASLDRSAIVKSGGSQSIVLEGWTLDPAVPSRSIETHIYVTKPDGSTTGYPIKADRSRPDVGAAFPGAGPNHGFAFQLPLTAAGPYRTCIWSIRTSGPAQYGCQTFVATQDAPDGRVDRVGVDVTQERGTLYAAGWAVDKITPSSQLDVHVYVTDPNGTRVGTAIPADQPRGDIANAYPAAGANHGYTFSRVVTVPGRYEVCVYAIGTREIGENNRLLGCSTQTFGPSWPIGAVDTLGLAYSTDSASLVVEGWTFDSSLPSAPTEAHVYVTAPSGRTVGTALKAVSERPDVARAFPAAGSAHGFRLNARLSEQGTYRVCAYGIGAPVFGSSNVALSCRDVRFGPTAPVGSLDEVRFDTADSTITANGWVLDDGLRGFRNQAHVYVESPTGARVGYVVTPNVERRDVVRAFPGASSQQGFTLRVAARERGTYRVCVYSIAATPLGTGNTALPCRNVLVG